MRVGLGQGHRQLEGGESEDVEGDGQPWPQQQNQRGGHRRHEERGDAAGHLLVGTGDGDAEPQQQGAAQKGQQLHVPQRGAAAWRRGEPGQQAEQGEQHGDRCMDADDVHPPAVVLRAGPLQVEPEHDDVDKIEQHRQRSREVQAAEVFPGDRQGQCVVDGNGMVQPLKQRPGHGARASCASAGQQQDRRAAAGLRD